MPAFHNKQKLKTLAFIIFFLIVLLCHGLKVDSQTMHLSAETTTKEQIKAMERFSPSILTKLKAQKLMLH